MMSTTETPKSTKPALPNERRTSYNQNQAPQQNPIQAQSNKTHTNRRKIDSTSRNKRRESAVRQFPGGVVVGAGGAGKSLGFEESKMENPVIESEDGDGGETEKAAGEKTGNANVPEVEAEDWSAEMEPVAATNPYTPAQEWYITSCKVLGIVPVSYFLKRIETPIVVMKHHGLGSKGAQAIAEALTHNVVITSLDLTDNWIEAEGGAAMGSMLSENSTLATLILSENRLGGVGGEEMARALSDNNTLKILNLKGNKLSDRDAIAFATALKSNTTLTHLDLSYNEIGDFGAVALGSALAINSGLKDLNLGWNNMRPKGLAALLGGIRDNLSLNSLNISWNGLGDDGGSALAEFLMKNNGLNVLNVSNTRMGDVAIQAIAKAIDQNYILKEFILRDNPFRDAGAIALFKALPNSNSIRKMDITNVKFSKDARGKLEEMLKEKPELTVVG